MPGGSSITSLPPDAELAARGTAGILAGEQSLLPLAGWRAAPATAGPDSVTGWHPPARSKRSWPSGVTPSSPGSAATGPPSEPQLVLLGRPAVLRVHDAQPGEVRDLPAGPTGPGAGRR